MKSKKGMAALQMLLPAVIIFVVAFIVLAFSGTFLTSIQATQTANSVAYNTTGFALTGVSKVAEQGPNIGLIIAIVVIIGLLIGGFGYFMNKRGK
jgi:uncharacterized membrane protein